MPRRFRRFRPIAVKRPAAKPAADPTKVINFITALVATQVGEDDDPSPLMKSLISDMGADAREVELAQDITLLGLDVMEAIAAAVKSGNPQSVVFNLMGVIGPAIPEIEADIKALQG